MHPLNEWGTTKTFFYLLANDCPNFVILKEAFLILSTNLKSTNNHFLYFIFFNLLQTKCYKTKFEPPKKEIKSRSSLSANIQKYLQKRDEDEKKKVEDEKRKKDVSHHKYFHVLITTQFSFLLIKCLNS